MVDRQTLLQDIDNLRFLGGVLKKGFEQKHIEYRREIFQQSMQIPSFTQVRKHLGGPEQMTYIQRYLDYLEKKQAGLDSVLLDAQFQNIDEQHDDLIDEKANELLDELKETMDDAKKTLEEAGHAGKKLAQSTLLVIQLRAGSISKEFGSLMSPFKSKSKSSQEFTLIKNTGIGLNTRPASTHHNEPDGSHAQEGAAASSLSDAPPSYDSAMNNPPAYHQMDPPEYSEHDQMDPPEYSEQTQNANDAPPSYDSTVNNPPEHHQMDPPEYSEQAQMDPPEYSEQAQNANDAPPSYDSAVNNPPEYHQMDPPEYSADDEDAQDDPDVEDDVDNEASDTVSESAVADAGTSSSPSPRPTGQRRQELDASGNPKSPSTNTSPEGVSEVTTVEQGRMVTGYFGNDMAELSVHGQAEGPGFKPGGSMTPSASLSPG